MPYCELWNVTNSVAHSGTYSITDVGNLEIRQDFAAIPTSQITQLGFWVLNPNNFDAGVVFELFYADNPNPNLYLNAIFRSLSTQQWTFIDATSSLLPGAQLVGFGINGYDRFPLSPQPRLYVDDVVLSTAVPEPSSLLLGVGGLAAILVRGVKRRE